MLDNPVRAKWKRGEAAIGCFMGLGSHHVAGLLANLGFEWLVIETEHNPLDLSDVERMITAMKGTRTVPLVRVPAGDMNFIQRSLDIGAMGVVVPMIKSADEAREIVRNVKYPPQGARGFGPLLASDYTVNTDAYLQAANDNTIVIVMIETKEAVEELEEIASIPGIDGLFMGQCDLCLSLGLEPMKWNEYPQVDAIIQKTLELGRRRNVATGLNMFTGEQLAAEKKKGHTILAYGPDYGLLARVAREGLDAIG